MFRIACLLAVCFATFAIPPETACAQPPGKSRRPAKGADKPKATPLPNDPRLLELHRNFVRDAEELADDYERDGELERARSVYREILKLVPAYPKARDRLERIRMQEATAARSEVVVQANRAWQDSGIVVQQGKPIRLAAEGQWTFKMRQPLNPDGMEIPKALKDFPLGALIGVIVTGAKDEPIEPFLIGSYKEFVAKKSGRLLVRMHDDEASDNEGRITLRVQGTFGQVGRPGK